MSSSKRLPKLIIGLILLITAGLTACGDSSTPTAVSTTTTLASTSANITAIVASPTSAAAPTTVASPTTTASPTTAALTTSSTNMTTNAASGTTAASSDGLPDYAGATAVTLPDTVKNQLDSSVGQSVVNPKVVAFVTADEATKVKTFYTDFLVKNGWKDGVALVGSNVTSQVESLNGFFLIYLKDKKVAVSLGLPASAAAGLGITGAGIPNTGTLVLNFTGEASRPANSANPSPVTNPTPAASNAATTVVSSPITNATIPAYTGATTITLPDSIKSQFSEAVGSSVTNPQVVAFITKDDRATVKAFYADYFSKNGWKDETGSLGSGGPGQMESTGGFFLLYTKDRTAVVLIGFPSSTAPALGVASADIPPSGMVVMGFSGQGK